MHEHRWAQKLVLAKILVTHAKKKKNIFILKFWKEGRAWDWKGLLLICRNLSTSTCTQITAILSIQLTQKLSLNTRYIQGIAFKGYKDHHALFRQGTHLCKGFHLILCVRWRLFTGLQSKIWGHVWNVCNCIKHICPIFTKTMDIITFHHALSFNHENFIVITFCSKL